MVRSSHFSIYYGKFGALGRSLRTASRGSTTLSTLIRSLHRRTKQVSKDTRKLFLTSPKQYCQRIKKWQNRTQMKKTWHYSRLWWRLILVWKWFWTLLEFSLLNMDYCLTRTNEVGRRSSIVPVLTTMEQHLLMTYRVVSLQSICSLFWKGGRMRMLVMYWARCLCRELPTTCTRPPKQVMFMNLPHLHSSNLLASATSFWYSIRKPITKEFNEWISKSSAINSEQHSISQNLTFVCASFRYQSKIWRKNFSTSICIVFMDNCADVWLFFSVHRCLR